MAGLYNSNHGFHDDSPTDPPSICQRSIHDMGVSKNGL